MDSDAPYQRDLSHTTWADVWDRQEKRGTLADDYWNLAGGRPGARVLELGCGPGYFALAYAARVGAAGHVTAVDVAPDAIAFLVARDTSRAVDARVVAPEASELPSGPFDITFITDVLHHADDPLTILREVRSRSARLVIAEFSPEGDPSYGPPLDERLTHARVRAWLSEAGWQVGGAHALAWDHYAIVADAPAPAGGTADEPL